MSKKDILTGLILGVLIGTLSIAVFKNLEKDLSQRFFWFSLKYIYPFPIILPILVLIGLFLAELFSKKIKVIWQLAKFVVVGVLNTFIDFGILGFLMWISGIQKGAFYVLFKFISFSCAATNSYFWNKFWTFEKGTQIKGKEYAGFYFVTAIGALINVGVATFLVNVVGPQFHISQTIWAGGVAPILGVLCGFIWNFLSYKFFIFKK